MTDPVAPDPDGKDWTWVLDRPCPDCGFDPHAVDDVSDRIRMAIAAMQAALARPDATQRPQPDVWSPLEYACHARDVCVVMGARLAMMRGADNPTFENWDQDATARVDRYWEQDPPTVSSALGREGERLATDFASVSPDELDRPGLRSNGARFTVATLGRYCLHDLEHHVHDISR